MTAETLSAVIWILIVGGGFIYEFFALTREDDEHHPLTYYIRKLFSLKNRKGPLYWILLGFWVWLGVHFFIDGP